MTAKNPHPVPVTIERAGTDEQSFIDVFELLVALHKEGGYAPMNERKAIEQTYGVLQQGMTFLARNQSGEPIGVVPIMELEFWYSDATFLAAREIYVKPRYRRGKVGQMLLQAAREEAQRRNKLLFVEIDNPDRRQKKTKTSLVAQQAGFVPLGYTLQLR